MAIFKPLFVSKNQLDTFPIKEGQYIVCPDTGNVFVDISNSMRLKLSEQSITNAEIDEICGTIIEAAEDIKL